MALRKLYPFVLVATLAGFATVGTLNVEIKEYDVPTPRSRPHDPALAPDGSLWYTGQGANKLGRFDPKTGEFKEYPLKTRDSGPHGLVADKDGNIWFTAISGGYIGKLDPKTGEITEYRPSQGAEIDRTDPAGPIFPRPDDELGRAAANVADGDALRHRVQRGHGAVPGERAFLLRRQDSRRYPGRAP